MDEHDSRAGAGGFHVHRKQAYKLGRFRPSHAALGCYKVCYARVGWSPRALVVSARRRGRRSSWGRRRRIGAGALVGWGAGSWPIGALVGAVVGIPAAILVVYRRYRDFRERRRLHDPAPRAEHPPPGRGGNGVIVLALPIYLIAGWRLEGWALAATLWVGSQAFSSLLARLRTQGTSPRPASPPSG